MNTRAETAALDHGGRHRRIGSAALVAAIVTLLWISVVGIERPPSVAANGVGTIFVVNEAGGSVSILEQVGHTVLETIAVDAGPASVAFSPDGRVALVASHDAGTITLIDRDVYETTGSIRVGGALTAIAAPPGLAQLFVADALGQRIAVLDAAGQVVRSIPVPGQPIALVAENTGRRLYVLTAGGGQVLIFDGPTGAAAGAVTVGTGGRYMALSPDAGTLYVSNPSANLVFVVDPAATQVSAQIGGEGEPSGLAVSPDGRQLFVANAAGNSLLVVDTLTRLPRRSVPTGTAPRAVSVSPDGRSAYVANAGSNNVTIIDTARLDVVKSVPVGAAPIAVGVTRPLGPSSPTGGLAAGPGGPGAGAQIGTAGTAFTIGQVGVAPGQVRVPSDLPATGDGSMAAATPIAGWIIASAAGLGCSGIAVAAMAWRRRRPASG